MNASPQAVDEQRHLEFRIVADHAMLRGRPIGEQRCDGCGYYLEPDADLSYCWHPEVRILVGRDWWCQWWGVNPGGAEP